MCETCGCGDPEIVSVDVHERILAGNDRTARHNREHFQEHGVVAVNLMGSPGSGKTAILEATARAVGHRRVSPPSAVTWPLTEMRSGSGRPAFRRSPSPPAPPATSMRKWFIDALHDLAWRACDFLFIENVGNLVCPAVYDLGQAMNVVALSVTEGEDKPLKYPVMFRKADLVLLTKIDLLPHLPEVHVATVADALARVMPRPAMLPLSVRTGEGLDRWLGWLEDANAGVRAYPASRRSVMA